MKGEPIPPEDEVELELTSTLSDLYSAVNVWKADSAYKQMGGCPCFLTSIPPVQEEDLFFGMWSQRVTNPDLQTAMSLDQAGFWARAQLAYEKALARLKTSTLSLRHSCVMRKIFQHMCFGGV